MFHFLHSAFWFDPGCWGQKQQLDVVATTTAAVLLLLCCCCCAAAAVLLENIALPHRTTSSSFPTCKMSQGDAELKGFVKCCWCCAAPSGAPLLLLLHDQRFSRKKCSASVFHFLHLAFWFDPGCCDQKQQLHGAAARAACTSLDQNSNK